MQYLFSALELLSRLSLFVVVTPILAGWFFVWMVIATAFAWFAWLIVIIILSDVPKMDDTRRDAALRFVTLVDALYDHHIVLVMSAAAAPEKLYVGTVHAGVFERTVSRIMEMQSRTYEDAA